MAILPDPSNQPRVAVRPSMQVASAGTGGEGAAIAGFGNVISGIAEQERRKITETEAQNAINQFQQKKMQLTAGAPDQNGKNGGYLTYKGANAVVTPNGGKPFYDKFKDQLQQSQDEIGGGLSGGAKRLFDAHAANMSLDFQSGLLRHHAGELGEYNKQVASNTLEGNAAGARMNWNNLDALAVLKANTINALDRYLSYTGVPDKQAVIQQNMVKFHDAVIDGAIAAGKPEYAAAYIKQNKDELGNSLLPLTEKVDHARQVYATAAVVAATEQHYAGDIQPLPTRQAFNVIDQVKGVDAPPSTQGDYQNFQTNLKQFNGNPVMAWAAHFGGADAVNAAVERARKSAERAVNDPSQMMLSWLDAMPKEVRDQTLKAQAAYEAGRGSNPPTLMQFKNTAVEALKRSYPDVTPTMLAGVAAGAEAKYNDMMANRNDLRDRTMVDVQRRIDTGDIKSFNDITPTEKMVLGTHEQSIRNYMKAKNEADDRILEASPQAAQAYENLRLSPEELIKPGSLGNIMALSDQIGIARVKQLVNMREQYLKDPTTMHRDSVNANLFTAETQALKGNTKELQVKRALLHDKVNEAINAEPTPPGNARVREIIQEQMINVPTVDKGPSSFLGIPTGRSTGSAQLYQTTPQDIIISPEDAKTVRTVAAQLGHPIAENDDAGLKAAYLGMLRQQQKAKK